MVNEHAVDRKHYVVDIPRTVIIVDGGVAQLSGVFVVIDLPDLDRGLVILAGSVRVKVDSENVFRWHHRVDDSWELEPLHECWHLKWAGSICGIHLHRDC